MSTAYFFNLLAQVDSLESFVSALRDKKGRMGVGDILAGLAILAAILLTVWVLVRMFEIYQRKRPSNSPGRLFVRLCMAHRLRLSQWWLLRQIARYQALKDPGRLFLEPERLEASNLGPLFRPNRLGIQALRIRLFGDLAETDRQAADCRKETRPSRTSETPMPLFPAAGTPALDVPPWPQAPGSPPDWSTPARQG